MVRVFTVFEDVEEEEVTEVESDVIDAEEVEVRTALEELCVEDDWLEVEVPEDDEDEDDEVVATMEVVVGIVVVDFVEDARSEYPPAAPAITITTITTTMPAVLLIACLCWNFMSDARVNYDPDWAVI